MCIDYKKKKNILIHKGDPWCMGILYMIHAVMNIYQQGYNTSMSPFCSITHCVYTFQTELLILRL